MAGHMTGGEMIDLVIERDRKIEELEPSDPKHPLGYARDDDVGGWDIWWGGYEYFIDDARLRDTNDLLSWIEQICEKDWEGTTPGKIGDWINSVRLHIGVPRV